MQFIPGNNIIWVEKLNDSDPIYSYNIFEEAENKKKELELKDPTRSYKIIER